MRSLLLCLIIVSTHFILSAQEDSLKQSKVPAVQYTNKGFTFTTPDSNFQMHIEWRGQFRISYPTDNDPITLEDFGQEKVHLSINRARMKVGGHGYKPYIKYYLEYEVFGNALLDFRFMFEKFSFLKFKIGQWKVQYNRERIISSGKQQTVERSILTRPFTVDRQQGISLFGRVGKGKIYDFNYWVSALSGTGRGKDTNDDSHLMYMTRLQWNMNGESLSFTGSDLKYHERFAAILAFGAVTNRSPYTRFSTAGGGQLPGFEEGVESQYRVNQWVQEFAFKYRGASLQQEFHWKEIHDFVNNTETTMTGNLAQIGYFPHYILSGFPKAIEGFFRYAFYNPNDSINNDLQFEYTIGLNWFVSGHRNKFSAEISFLNFQSTTDQASDDNRIRVQWDVSF